MGASQLDQWCPAPDAAGMPLRYGGGSVPVTLGKMGPNGLALDITASYLKVAGSNDGVPAEDIFIPCGLVVV